MRKAQRTPDLSAGIADSEYRLYADIYATCPMIHFLIIGTVLGLSAGLTPGPLLTLVISETMTHDVRAGIKVALAPIITDLPIICLTLAVLAGLRHLDSILGLISFAGAGLLLHMGIHSMKISSVDVPIEKTAKNSLLKGVLVNVLSPHPYLFWISIGGPTSARAMEESAFAFAAFFVSFYFCLVFSKILLAAVTGKSKSFLTGRLYRTIMRCLGAALCVLGVFLIYDGCRLMRWI